MIWVYTWKSLLCPSEYQKVLVFECDSDRGWLLHQSTAWQWRIMATEEHSNCAFLMQGEEDLTSYGKNSVYPRNKGQEHLTREMGCQVPAFDAPLLWNMFSWHGFLNQRWVNDQESRTKRQLYIPRKCDTLNSIPGTIGSNHWSLRSHH